MSIALLLAAGHSRRFGAQDKLLAPLAGRPLIAHAASALRESGAKHCFAVIRNRALIPYLDGFELVSPKGEEMSHSLQAGLAAAVEAGPARLLIALGDMPNIPASHLRRLLTADGIRASQYNGIALPPAAFPAGQWPEASMLNGDSGAGTLLKNLPLEALWPLSPRAAHDVDYIEDLRDLA